MDEEKRNISYSAEDIRNYLDGKLTGPEMQAMEKAALEDPFLADAIEGYEESRKQSVSFESGVADLQKRLTERIHQKRRKAVIPTWFKRWPVAASILFILGIAVLTFTIINRKSHPPELADTIRTDSSPGKKGAGQPDTGAIVKMKTETGKPSTDEIPAESNIKSSPLPSSEDLAFNKSSRKKNTVNIEDAKTVYKEKVPPGASDDSDKVTSNFLYKRSDTNIDQETMAGIVKDKDLKSSPALPVETQLQGRVAGVEISRKRRLQPFYVQGIVMNEKGDPVWGATVSLASSKIGTTTDSNGYFKLYIKNQDSVRKLVFNSVGYQSFSTAVNSDSSFTNRIHLQTSNQSLNDVVVIGYGAKETDNSPGFFESMGKKKKSDSDSESDSVKNKNVQPINGWNAFKNNVYRNKKIGTADSLLKGMEVVSFIVDEKGQLSSFKIQKSISPAHDTTVINLIKGTGWKILKGKKQKCTIAVPYQ